MKKFIFVVCIALFSISCYAQCVKVASWNLSNFGKSKSADEIEVIAKTIKDADLLSIQEVSTSSAGAQAVAQLADALNRKGAKWDYSISDPTSGNGSERYAFLWKTSKVKSVKKGWLEKSLEALVDREPYLGIFAAGKDTFMLVNFHAVPKDKSPELENSQLSKIDELYEKNHVLIMGDFNSPSSSVGFMSLVKKNYIASLSRQKTTIKMKPNKEGEHLANEYDNIFYESDEIVMSDKGVYDFSTAYKDLKMARQISDHIPVWGCYTVKKKK